jgi:hypothetical protein
MSRARNANVNARDPLPDASLRIETVRRAHRGRSPDRSPYRKAGRDRTCLGMPAADATGVVQCRKLGVYLYPPVPFWLGPKENDCVMNATTPGHQDVSKRRSATQGKGFFDYLDMNSPELDKHGPRWRDGHFRLRPGCGYCSWSPPEQEPRCPSMSDLHQQGM